MSRGRRHASGYRSSMARAHGQSTLFAPHSTARRARLVGAVAGLVALFLLVALPADSPTWVFVSIGTQIVAVTVFLIAALRIPDEARVVWWSLWAYAALTVLGNIVYDALRMRLSHAWLMDDDSATALGHAVLFRQWGMTPASLEAELDGDKFAPPALSASALAAFASHE